MRRPTANSGTRPFLLLGIILLFSLPACSGPDGEKLRLRRELLHQQETNQKLRQELQSVREALLEARDGQEALFEKLEKMIQENRRLKNQLQEQDRPADSLIPDTDPANGVPESLPGKEPEGI